MQKQWSMAKKTLEGGIEELQRVIKQKKTENIQARLLKQPF
jgi:hypothetical protein